MLPRSSWNLKLSPPWVPPIFLKLVLLVRSMAQPSGGCYRTSPSSGITGTPKTLVARHRLESPRRRYKRSELGGNPTHNARPKSGSHQTRRWREMDSNPRSRFTYSPFRTPSCRPRDGPVRPNGNHAFATGYQAFDACVRRRVSGARAITAMVLRSRLQNPVEGRLRRAPDASTAVCEIVELTSAATRAEAHAFYRSIGYEPNSLRFRKVLVA